MSFWRKIFGGYSGLTQNKGQQGLSLASTGCGADSVGTDQALGLSGIWAATTLLADTISTLPLFVYNVDGKGQRQLARGHRLWRILHDKPNNYMTAPTAISAMVVNYSLHNNAYAEIMRDSQGQAVGYMPLSTDQVSKTILDDGAVVYGYRINSETRIVADQNMIHWQGIGNGLIGLDTLAYASKSLGIAIKVESAASDVFANAGKLSGILTLDNVLTDVQREALGKKFSQLALNTGSGRTIPVLEANMKFQAVQMTAEQQQLGMQRRFSVEDMGRIMGVPSVLLNEHSSTSSWGSGVAEIKEGFATFKLRPMCKRLEAELSEKMLTPSERQTMSIEFSFDGLLRASPEKRAVIYKEGIQNGYATPNEVRQLENMPPLDGGDLLYMQRQMAPIELLLIPNNPVTIPAIGANNAN